ncbi:hypothetical protein ACIA49_24575 [Kribbella sp. NPDC051587]|uniref:hypothetical protein n=1 Tax=Kribbella sp. NPDC051587 TaxID=3364119 RepID=UPI0037B85304
MLTASELATYMVREAGYPAAVQPASVALAERLLGLAELVPAESNLILGGSLARGEPSFVELPDGTYELDSDIDLLLVFPTPLAPFTNADFVARAKPVLPTVTIMFATTAEYSALKTSLGTDFKQPFGVSLNQDSLPIHEPFELDARDAYEVFLFSLQAYLWRELPERWAADPHDRSFQLELSSLCVKLLRSTVLLQGGTLSLDRDRAPSEILALIDQEIGWRRTAGRPALDPGRFWVYVARVLPYFDAAFGGRRPDSVIGSEYEGRFGADAVAWQQRIGLVLATAVVEQVQATGGRAPDVAEVVSALRASWTRLAVDGFVEPTSAPGEYFAGRLEWFRGNLYAMKVRPGLPAGLEELEKLL